MNKRDRSIANMRSEAKKIYYQRQEIKRNELKIKQLQQELTDYKERNEKAIEYIKGFDIERLHEVCEHNLAETLEALLEILDKKE